jgi:hypothetical protein
MIKNLKPSGRYKSGHYIPINKDKYCGEYPIIYRSSWEHKLCIFLDMTPTISEWASEPFEIPYFSPIDNKMHRYYPDFYFKAMQVNGGAVKYVIEIKPSQYMTPPIRPEKQSTKLYERYNANLKRFLVIVAKMKAAKAWCAERGMKYIFGTEKEWNKIIKV